MATVNATRYSRSVSPKTRYVPLTHSWEHKESSDYGDDDESTNIARTASPYRPIPSSMNVFYSWMAMKTLHVCGASKDERLYVVDVHTGYSGRKPLGTRPGLILHNGTSTKDPILAAICDESQMAARFYTFNLNSVILLPPLSSGGAGSKKLVTEMMRARTFGDHGFAFRFSVEVNRGDSLCREQFEWRSMKKGENAEAKDGGFKLVQVTPDTQEGSSSQPATEDGSEILALLSWTKKWWLTHPFALQLKGSGLSGALGDRWTLTVVLTALRIWVLRLNFRSNRGIISLAESIRGK
ncbi:hypothetical protein F4818DRAFT_213379 [Hypoxylon cercidicola]|nr:hypothetical protein F4818DRAFT_213379 [Hypoxylon cercidicola]